MQIIASRRDFLAGASLAAAAARSFAPGSRLPTTGRRKPRPSASASSPSLCLAPQYAAEELLRAEGFTDVRYVTTGPGLATSEKIARGEVDFSLNFAAPLVIPMAAGQPLTVIAGVHPRLLRAVRARAHSEHQQI